MEEPPKPHSLHGLEKLCRYYGRMKCGEEVRMVWDYANECAVPESLMPEGSDAWRKSERAKWAAIQCGVLNATSVSSEPTKP